MWSVKRFNNFYEKYGHNKGCTAVTECKRRTHAQKHSR